MTDFKTLRTHYVTSASQFTAPQVVPEALNTNSNAMTLLQDFTAQAPIRILANTPLNAARKLASATPTDALLVVDERNNVLGVTSSVELQSARVTTQAAQMGINPSELLVHDMMRSLHTLPCISMLTARNTTLGNVLSTMEHRGSFYLLVTDKEASNWSFLRPCYCQKVRYRIRYHSCRTIFSGCSQRRASALTKFCKVKHLARDGEICPSVHCWL